MSKEQTKRPSDLIEQAILKKRRIFLNDAVDNESADVIIRKLWFYEADDPTKPILFVINSPGGSVDAGFAVWDQIKMIKAPVTTLITGLAASMGSVLGIVAPKGRRLVTPHARLMIHQPAIGGVIKGQATDLEIQAKEILKSRDSLVKLYMEATGKDYETIEKAIDRDTWLSAKEALEFGLVDEIVDDMEALEKKGLAC